MNRPLSHHPGTLGHATVCKAEPAIRLEGVAKTFASRDGASAVLALSDIDLDVASGSIVGVIGRSGAGKSTLIRLINGLEKPTSGRVVVGGTDLTTLSEPRACPQLRFEGAGMGFPRAMMSDS